MEHEEWICVPLDVEKRQERAAAQKARREGKRRLLMCMCLCVCSGMPTQPRPSSPYVGSGMKSRSCLSSPPGKFFNFGLPKRRKSPWGRGQRISSEWVTYDDVEVLARRELYLIEPRPYRHAGSAGGCLPRGAVTQRMPWHRMTAQTTPATYCHTIATVVGMPAGDSPAALAGICPFLGHATRDNAQCRSKCGALSNILKRHHRALVASFVRNVCSPLALVVARAKAAQIPPLCGGCPWAMALHAEPTVRPIHSAK